jgi:hypothetical protein
MDGQTRLSLSTDQTSFQLASILGCDKPKLPELRTTTRRAMSVREMSLGALLTTLTSGPDRLPGTEHGRRAETFLANAYEALGCEVMLQEVPVHDWRRGATRLEVDGQAVTCSAVPFSPFGAMSGRLVYVGGARDLSGHDVRGAIVVAEQGFPMQPIDQLWAQRLPGTTLAEPTTGVPAWWLNAPGVTPVEAEQAGALGLVHVLVDQLADSPWRYGPYQGPAGGVPAVYVCRTEGESLKEAAARGRNATLSIEGSMERCFSNNIVAELEGASGRVYLFQSHYDSPGPGAVDDAASLVAMLEVARHYAALPVDQRPGRMVFACTTGHFDASIGVRMLARDVLPKWRHRYRGIFSLAQIGAKSVRKEGGRLVATDALERQDVFVPDHPRLRSAVVEALKAAQLSNTLVLPDRTEVFPVPPGEGGSLCVAGLPTVQFTSAPPYLLTNEDSVDKVDLARVSKQVDMLIDIVGRL